LGRAVEKISFGFVTGGTPSDYRFGRFLSGHGEDSGWDLDDRLQSALSPRSACPLRRGELGAQIDLEKDDQNHLISPEERFKVAMARQ
jgi:hypothetical protein